MQTLTVISKTSRCRRWWFGRFQTNSPLSVIINERRIGRQCIVTTWLALHGHAFIPLDKLRCF
jgi:hypothetical protein